MTYNDWAQRHPHAAAELKAVLMDEFQTHEPDLITTEAHAQQQVRFEVARRGGLSWRNNVGATPSKCPSCGERSRPIRYGLANDSSALNEKIKSSDLILAIPRRVTPNMVGRTIAQFGAVETKRPGWRYTGHGREAAQSAWLTLIAGVGGFACFSTGIIKI